MKSLTLDLTRWEAHCILEALTELDAKWANICQTSEDEDDVRAFDSSVMERDGPVREDGLTPLEQMQLLKRYVRRQEYEQRGVRWHLTQALAMVGDDVAASEQALL